MESGIQKLSGVEAVRVNFMTQRMTLEAEDAVFDRVLEEAAALCRRIEPDCEILWG